MAYDTDLAATAARRVVQKLSERSGFDSVIDAVDKDTYEELLDELAAVIRKVYEL